jgi:aryl-alcohol dehydrogenase-like predicted oxidoreductase
MEDSMVNRRLGRSGIEVSSLGLGCWAIGGPYWDNGRPNGWGQVDDQESLRALARGLELGVTFFDTADIYGCGHSERLLGQALIGRRDQVVIATKFGITFDEATRQVSGRDASPNYIRSACDASLRRLQTDYIDLYQFHLGDFDPVAAGEVRDVLEGLAAAGKIRSYGWSTDDPNRARVFAEGAHCAAVQNHLNLFDDNPAMLALCEHLDLASVIRGPLAMGLLTGKFTPESRLPADDVRHQWNFETGTRSERLEQLAKLREVLTHDGRTLAQAALGWLWARSPQTVPIPGFKTIAQVEENVGAMAFGALNPDQMRATEQMLRPA